MNKKKNLMNIFSNDIEYYYHLIKNIDQNGHILYIINSDKELKESSLEFKSTYTVIEYLISNDCNTNIEKIAPSVYFIDDNDTENIKTNLNKKLIENSKFSKFIEKIRNKYRILEIKEFLLYKKDPDTYINNKKNEKIEHQKKLLEKLLEQNNEENKKREERLLSYNNDIISLLKDYILESITYKKEDFDFYVSFNEFVTNFSDNNKKLSNIKIVDINKNIYISSNENNITKLYSVRLEKTNIIIEDTPSIVKNILEDYDILINLFNINRSNIGEWDFKTDNEKTIEIINHLNNNFILKN